MKTTQPDSRVECCSAKEMNESDPPGPRLLETGDESAPLEAVSFYHSASLDSMPRHLLLPSVQENALVGSVRQNQEDENTADECGLGVSRVRFRSGSCSLQTR